MYDSDYIDPIMYKDIVGGDTIAFSVEGQLKCATCMQNIAEYNSFPLTYVLNPYYRNIVNIGSYKFCSGCGYKFSLANKDLVKFKEDFNIICMLAIKKTIDLQKEYAKIVRRLVDVKLC